MGKILTNIKKARKHELCHLSRSQSETRTPTSTTQINITDMLNSVQNPDKKKRNRLKTELLPRQRLSDHNVILPGLLDKPVIQNSKNSDEQSRLDLYRKDKG
jgi:hypothetical protein